MSDEPEDPDEEPSLTDLVEQLARDTSRLTLHEAGLAASQHVPELRRAALWLALAAAVVLAFLAAFAVGNWAAVAGLSTWLPEWLAALVVAAAWAIVGLGLLAIARSRLRRGATGVWLRLLGDDRQEAIAEVQASRDEAEQAVRDSLDRFGSAVAAVSAAQLADAVVPLAGSVGDELLDASGDMVEDLVESIPGSGAIGQVVDIVLFPGRIGFRIATTVFRGGYGRQRVTAATRACEDADGGPGTSWSVAAPPRSSSVAVWRRGS